MYLSDVILDFSQEIDKTRTQQSRLTQKRKNNERTKILAKLDAADSNSTHHHAAASSSSDHLLLLRLLFPNTKLRIPFPKNK
jgi:hypothetical protein